MLSSDHGSPTRRRAGVRGFLFALAAAFALAACTVQPLYGPTVGGGQVQATLTRIDVAPGQRVPDFLAGRLSRELPEMSYFPGATSAPLHELLPKAVASRMRAGSIA